MNTRHSLLFLGTLIALVAVAMPSASFAQLADGSSNFNGLLDLIRTTSNSWFATLQGYAVTLFWSLATIQFVLTFFPLVFRQADFGEIVGELVKFILVVGFFFWILTGAQTLATTVIDSFRQAGASAAGLGGTGLVPGDVFALATELADTVTDVVTLNPMTGASVALAGLVVMLCFAFIAAFMALTLVESYIVVNAAVLFLGFGGSEYTRNYALALARYALAVGAKLFILTLIIGLILTSARTWQAAYTADDASMWTLVGLSLTCAYLTKTIPELIAGMISGVSPGGGSALGGMAVAGAVGAAAAATTLATAGSSVAGALGGGAKAAGGVSGSGGLSKSLGASLQSGPPSSPLGLSAPLGGGGSAPTGGSGGSRIGGSSAFTSPLTPPAAQVSGSPADAIATSSGAASGPTAASAPVGPSQDASEAPTAPSESVQTAAEQVGSTGGNEAGGGSQKSASSAGSGPMHAPGRSAPSTGRAVSAAAGKTAQGTVRSAGILAAISVPGMEGAAALSMGLAPSLNLAGSDDNLDADREPPSENVIRPANSDSKEPKNG